MHIVYEGPVVPGQMEELRKMLDEEGIEWKDLSDYNEPVFIRTHIPTDYGTISIAIGRGTYGGTMGFLELYIINGGYEPIGWLTAEEAFKTIKKAIANKCVLEEENDN